MSEYEDGLMEAWRKWALKHGADYFSGPGSAMDLITPRRTKIRYSRWRGRRFEREWQAALDRTTLGIQQTAAERAKYLSRVYTAFEESEPRVFKPEHLLKRLPRYSPPFEHWLLPTMTEPNTVNYFTLFEVRRPIRRMPAWLPLWLRRAIIMAIPSCTLWEPMSWRESATMKVWPYWTVDRTEVEDLR